MADLAVYLIGTGRLGAAVAHALRGLDGVALCGGAVRDPGGATAAALATFGIAPDLVVAAAPDLAPEIAAAAPDLVVVVGELREGALAPVAAAADRGALVCRAVVDAGRLTVTVLTDRGDLAWRRERRLDSPNATATRSLTVDALTHAVAAVRDRLAVRAIGGPACRRTATVAAPAAG